MKSSTVRDVSRGSFYLGLEQLTMMIGGVLYSIMVLRMLGPETYGILTLGLATIGLAGILTTNIETYLERFVAELDARGMGKTFRPLVRKVFLVKALLALAAGMLVALLADPIATAYGYRDLRRLLPALAPLIFLEGVFLVLRFTLFGLRRFRAIWVVVLMNNVLKLIVVFILWRMNEGVVALVAGLVAIQTVTVIGLAAFIIRSLPRSEAGEGETPSYRRIWDYVLPLYGARIFFLSGQHLNRLILGALLDAHSLGLISFALLTIERFIGMASSISNSLLPALARLRGEGRDKSIEQVVNEGYRLVAAMAVLLMAGVFCFAREAVLITGGSLYLEAILPLQILALIPLLRTLQQPLTMSFYTYEKTRAVLWLAALKFVVEPICYPFLIPHFGIVGVALASLLSSIVVFGPALRIAGGLFPSTRALRLRGALTTWALGISILIVGVLIRLLEEPWPGLLARGLLLVAAVVAVLSTRMVSGEDLRRIGEVTNRPWAERLLAKLASWMDRGQGQRAT